MILRILCFAALAIFISSCGLFAPGSLGGGSVADADLADILFLNEVSADNPDDDDWAELYNSGDKAIGLSGFYLSDDSLTLAMWAFPEDTYIAGKGYLVITFNGESGPLNADFGLSAGADSLYLSAPRDTSIIDSIATIPVTGTGSYGRSSDGGALWSVFTVSTKGRANQ